MDLLLCMVKLESRKSTCFFCCANCFHINIVNSFPDVLLFSLYASRKTSPSVYSRAELKSFTFFMCFPIKSSSLFWPILCCSLRKLICIHLDSELQVFTEAWLYHHVIICSYNCTVHISILFDLLCCNTILCMCIQK